MFDIVKLKRNKNKKKCLKCENYKENQCILNHDINLEQYCEDFTSKINFSNLSKEEVIELFKNIQKKLNHVLIGKKITKIHPY